MAVQVRFMTYYGQGEITTSVRYALVVNKFV